MNHAFTDTLLAVLERHFDGAARKVFDNSPLLQYLNIKTRSANRGSKSRSSFANLYALYVLVEDYIDKGFASGKAGRYAKYEGARFTDLFRRQRELPFGSKLQNHALNSRLNSEFARYFPTLETPPVLRDQKEQRYWVAEKLLRVDVTGKGAPKTVNIATAIIEIVDTYVHTKQSAFRAFMEACRKLARLSDAQLADAVDFVREQLKPSVDARVFEIVSYAVLKAHYGEKSIFWGWSRKRLREESLALYKTGRTNANDGGIDFVMKPLGRLFQVTETIDANKYFLDIDKVQRFPITFVVKSDQSPETILAEVRRQAQRKYEIETIVNRYTDAIEEIINGPMLLAKFEASILSGALPAIMDEIVRQSRVEFNFDNDEDDEQDLP